MTEEASTVRILNRSPKTIRTPAGERLEQGQTAEVPNGWAAKQPTQYIMPVDLYQDRMGSAREVACKAECKRLGIDYPEGQARKTLFAELGLDSGAEEEDERSWGELWSRASDVADALDLNVEEEAGGRGADKLRRFLDEYEEQVDE